MKRVFVAVKYDVEFNDLCDANEFIRGIDILRQEYWDVVEMCTDDETCYELSRDGLNKCLEDAKAHNDDEIVVFIMKLLAGTSVDNKRIHIKLY